MAEQLEAPAQAPAHGLRIFLIWLILALPGDLVIWFVLGPHLPPGTMSTTAVEEQRAIKLMAVMSAPVIILVLTYFIYAMVVWRHRADDDEDGPPLHSNSRIQTIWIAGTTVIVLGLAVYGTAALWTAHGAGAGEGPAPIFTPAETTSTTSWSPGQILQVQVVAQQWKFTYRYPQFGGFETSELVVPEGQWVQFNVT
jgi:cytochrome c oxidase subunit 2